MDPEEYYTQLGYMIADMPDLVAASGGGNHRRWLGRAFALVQSARDMADTMAFRQAQGDWARGNLADGELDRDRRRDASERIQTILYRRLGVAELQAPGHLREKFIPAGGLFAALEAISSVTRRAEHDVLIVDPYLNEQAMVHAKRVSAGVRVRLLGRENKRQLIAAAAAWTAEFGERQPLEIRLGGHMHDRLIITDGAEVWNLTQSLNGFAIRAPASVVRSDADTSAMKVETYAQTWADATSIIPDVHP